MNVKPLLGNEPCYNKVNINQYKYRITNVVSTEYSCSKRRQKAEFPYRVDAEAFCVGDAEGVVLVCKDDDVGDRVDPQRVVVRPEHGAHVQGQGCQVALG